MFQNYSQTYASAIVAVSGFLVVFLQTQDIIIAESDMVYVLGTVMNFGGIVWNLYHRYKKGDVTVLGSRLPNNNYTYEREMQKKR